MPSAGIVTSCVASSEGPQRSVTSRRGAGIAVYLGDLGLDVDWPRRQRLPRCLKRADYEVRAQLRPCRPANDVRARRCTSLHEQVRLDPTITLNRPEVDVRDTAGCRNIGEIADIVELSVGAKHLHLNLLQLLYCCRASGRNDLESRIGTFRAGKHSERHRIRSRARCIPESCGGRIVSARCRTRNREQHAHRPGSEQASNHRPRDRCGDSDAHHASSLTRRWCSLGGRRSS